MNSMNSIQVVNGQQVTIANNGMANVVASHSGGHTVHTACWCGGRGSNSEREAAEKVAHI